MINRQFLGEFPAAVRLFCVTASARNSWCVSSFSVSCFFLCISLSFLTLFFWLLLFLFPLSLATACPSLPLSVYLPSSPPFSLLPSWQQCQSGQAQQGKHSTGQSRGRSKGWRIDYVYVCVLDCPVPVCFGCLSPVWSYATASDVSPLWVYFVACFFCCAQCVRNCGFVRVCVCVL